MRVTSKTVSDVFIAVRDSHTRDEGFTRFLSTALQIGSDIGHGTRYIGMGGMMSVEYGGLGSRRALAYLYGIGAESQAWETLPESDPERWNRVRATIDEARNYLGQQGFEQWESLGRHYATKY